MSTPERDKQREATRAPADCVSTAKAPETCNISGPIPYSRPVDPCNGSVPVDPCTIDPTLFVKPSPAPAAFTPELGGLPVVNLFNAEGTAACSGVGIIGAPTTVAAGTLTTTVSLSVAAGITSSQRSIIATLTQLELDAFAVASAVQIAAATSLSLAQAQQIHAAIASTQAALDEQASLVALLTLNCYWTNAEQIVSCGGSSITAAYTVTAGTVVSYVSQAAANAQAVVLGTSLLHCQWQNVRKTAACPDGADVATGTNPVAVEAGTITSDVSQVDADNQAQAAADAALVCQYSNAEQTQECLPDSDGVPALLISNPITVAAGTVKSSVSVANADTQAIALVTAQLQCQWGNTELIFTCPDVTLDAVVYAASETLSPSYRIVIPANSYFSGLSQADANSTAAIFGLAALDCIYCNVNTPAKCAFVGGTDLTNSDDETADVPAGTFCGSTPEEAKALADALAYIPIKTKTNGASCRFSNDAVTRTCEHIDPAPVASGVVGSVTIPAGMVSVYIDNASIGGGTGAVATSSVAGGVVTGFTIINGGSGYAYAPFVILTGGGGTGAVAATMVTGGVITGLTVINGGSGYATAPSVAFTRGGGKDAVNILANNLADSFLSCLWANDEVTGADCTAPLVTIRAAGVGAAATATVAGGVVTSIAVTSGGSDYVVAPSVILTGGGGAGAEAVAAVVGGVVVGIGVIHAGSGYATAPSVTLTGGGGARVQAGKFMSAISKADANYTAQQIADALVVCVNPTIFESSDPTAGSLDGSSHAGPNPYTIKCKIVEVDATTGLWKKVDVTVRGGYYQTAGGSNFICHGRDHEFDKSDIVLTDHIPTDYPERHNVYFRVPIKDTISSDVAAVKASDGSYVKAIAGGEVGMSSVKLPEFPQIVGSSVGRVFYVFIGSWDIKGALLPGSTTKWMNRVSVDQAVERDIVLTNVATDTSIADYGFSGTVALPVSASPVPFTPLNVSAGGSLKVAFVPGTVNGVSPALGGVTLDNASPPSATITATTWFWLKCVGTFGVPDTYAVTIESNTTGATPAGTTITGTGFVSFTMLAKIPVAGGLIDMASAAQYAAANLGVESFGTVNFWWDF